MANVQELKQKLADKANNAARFAVIDMVNDLKNAAPVGKVNGGTTRDSIEVEPLAQTYEYTSYRFSVSAPQGEFVEGGTIPHIIRVTNGAKAWGFLNTDGSMISSKVTVHHPGTEAKPWFHPITERWREYLMDHYH